MNHLVVMHMHMRAKFDSKTCKCFMVEYGNVIYQGYRLYDVIYKGADWGRITLVFLFNCKFKITVLAGWMHL